MGYIAKGSLFNFIGDGEDIAIATHGVDAASVKRATHMLEERNQQLNSILMKFRPQAFLTCLFGFILLSVSVAGAYRLIYSGDGISWPSIIIFAVMGATTTTLVADALAWRDHSRLLSFALTALAAIIFILLEKLQGALTSRKTRSK